MDVALYSYADTGVSGYGTRVSADLSWLQEQGYAVTHRQVAPSNRPAWWRYASVFPAGVHAYGYDWAVGRSDVVIAEGLYLMSGLKPRSETKIVLVEHNIESVYASSRASSSPFPKNCGYWAAAGRTWLYERAALRRADVVVNVSTHDRDIAWRLGAARPVYVPTISMLRRRQEPWQPEGEVVLLGTWDYEPNREGLAWFMKEVQPSLERWGIDVAIVGRGGSHAWSRRGVRYYGVITDLAATLEQALCVCVPIWFGGGTRVKILDAWQVGCPVVTTPTGCLGLAAEVGSNVSVAASSDAMASCIRALITQPSHGEMLITGGFETTDRLYSQSQFNCGWAEAMGLAV